MLAKYGVCFRSDGTPERSIDLLRKLAMAQLNDFHEHNHESRGIFLIAYLLIQKPRGLDGQDAYQQNHALSCSATAHTEGAFSIANYGRSQLFMVRREV